MNKLKLIHLFSGIGAPEKALKNIGIPINIIGYSEIDKYAIKSYEAIHGKQNNFGSIEDIKQLPYCDLLVYGFPCTSVSSAGKQKGLIDENGNKTRSGLLLDVERLLETAVKNNTQPKILLMENVKNLVSKKFKPDFDKWLNKLEELGYNNYWQVLNAKDYGIPQNRERVFVVSILKEIDNKGFEFPKKIKLNKKIKDILEVNIDDKFYLSDKIIEKIKNSNFNQERARIQGDICQTLLARDYKDPKCVEVEKTDKIKLVGNIYPNSGNPQAGRIYEDSEISPTLDTCSGGNRMPKVIAPYKVDDKYYCSEQMLQYIENKKLKDHNFRVEINKPENILHNPLRAQGDRAMLEEPVIVASRGRNPENPSDRTAGAPTEQRLEVNSRGISNTLTTVQKDNYVLEPNIIIDDTQTGFNGVRNYKNYAPTLGASRYGLKTCTIDYRIRKLTPTECWRLMGFADEDINKAIEAGISNSQLYKQAGNSIVVNVLEAIFYNLFIGDWNENYNNKTLTF